MIDPNLGAMGMDGLLGNRVKVYVPEKEPYDTFFLNAARVLGTIALADTLIDELGQSLMAVSGGAAEISRANLGEWPELLENLAGSDRVGPGELGRLKDSGARLEALVPLLAALRQQVPSLLSQGNNLVASAPKDFTGWTGKLNWPRLRRPSRVSWRSLWTLARTLCKR